MKTKTNKKPTKLSQTQGSATVLRIEIKLTSLDRSYVSGQQTFSVQAPVKYSGFGVAVNMLHLLNSALVLQKKPAVHKPMSQAVFQ